jgi:hypothetical protein
MRRKTRGGLEALGGVLRRDKDIKVPPRVESSPVAFRDWEAAVGSRIAARARPSRLERGVLQITTASATWAQELSLLGDAIVVQLRARGVSVNSLRFRVGKVEPPARPPSRDEVRVPPREVPLPQQVTAELIRVADPDLRDAIARAAAKNLGWQAAQTPPSGVGRAASGRIPAPPAPASSERAVAKRKP